ncbi:hypothetical protein OCU04_002036 [Sclerotinia nivalis]|uniref:Uncharacterized protein n=1 Tax=Sclerotinia nivalis TaxID=352851 RepID=A0A9X0AZC4_9HELO|nr:hypothetical protein OCU04_002036 [Sclerotinia nivalis]
MAKAAMAPPNKLIRALDHYLNAPCERRGGGVPFGNELEDEERNAGLCSEDCARILMIILWAVNSNVQMATFWTMTSRRDRTCHVEDRAPPKHKSRYHGKFDKERFGRSLPASKFCH